MRLVQKVIFMQLLICLYLCFPIGSVADGGLMLKATVQHSARLQPLEPGLTEGSTFNSSILSKYTPLNVWYKIPSWSAGQWHTEQETAMNSRDEVTGKLDATPLTFTCRGDEDWGMQKDSKGQIWHWNHSPYTTESEMDDALSYSLVKKCTPVKISETEVVKRFESVSILVDKSSKVILSSGQRESIQSYEPYGEHQMRVIASVRAFDEHGLPKRTGTTVSTITRTSDFTANNEYQGQNLRILFRRFLTDTGQLDLLP